MMNQPGLNDNERKNEERIQEGRRKNLTEREFILELRISERDSEQIITNSGCNPGRACTQGRRKLAIVTDINVRITGNARDRDEKVLMHVMYSALHEDSIPDHLQCTNLARLRTT